MAKEIIMTADDYAAECLELQLSKSRESRFENILVTVLTMGFVLLFAVLFWRGLNIAVNSKNRFYAYCALGLTLLLAIQTVINLLVVVGFAPVTGITLPFVSYGGSSLIVSLAIVGLLLNISQYTEKNK